MRRIILPLWFVIGSIAGAESVWVEGEDADRRSVNPHGWYDSVKSEELSGGAWLSNFAQGDARVGTAEYDLTIPADGSYAFWLRANPVGTSLAMKLGEGGWEEIDTQDGWSDQINVAGDGKLDIRFVAWKKVGTYDLKAGPLVIAFRMDSDNHNHGAIDCFALTTDQWRPDGILKPGETAEANLDTDDDGTTWAFRYGGDTLRDGSAIDLRRLNEEAAGSRGFITRTKDGDAFAYGDGTPARFWAVGSGAGRLSDDDLARNARFLAKLGVNMVRFHGSFSPKEDGAKLTDVDRKEIERCWRLVAAMKQEGIYTTISPFWAHAGHSGAQASWGLEGYGDREDVWGLIFFNDKLKAAYKEWMRELYTKANPHTGIPLAKDPAVALIQIQNEDSLLFYTMQGIKGPQKEILVAKYSAWLKKKYGSVAKAAEAWNGDTVDGDDFEDDVASVIGVWEMTQERQGGRARRLADQTQFLGEMQRGFYKEIYDFYRNELGCKQLINACNWKSASEAKLGDLERWTYGACDVIAVNKYYNGGRHVGADNGWRINPGDFFQSESAVRNPLALPTALKQNAGKPMIITESTWVHPLEYQSEGPFLMMAYQSLCGIDGYYWFSHGAVEYTLEPYHSWAKVNGQYGLRKWDLPPAIETMFPAAALAYRMGYVEEAPPVTVEARSLDELWRRELPLISEGARFDPNRDTDFAEGKVAGTESDPALFLAGRVVVEFEGDEKADEPELAVRNAAPGRIESVTGQLVMDAKSRLCTLDAPSAQGAAGFVGKAGEVMLSALSIASENDYATILAVSLDGKPLAESGKVLVQCGTTMRPTGWKTEPATHEGAKGERIVNTGEMPWRAVVNKTTITLKTRALSKATVLDTAGFPRGQIELEDTGNSAVTFAFPRDAVWVVVE